MYNVIDSINSVIQAKLHECDHSGYLSASDSLVINGAL